MVYSRNAPNVASFIKLASANFAQYVQMKASRNPRADRGTLSCSSRAHSDSLYLVKSSFGGMRSPPARRQLITSYKIRPTAVTLPIRLTFSHIFPRASEALTVICTCPSTQASLLRVVRVRRCEYRFFLSE